jgi:hypothetical protein
VLEMRVAGRDATVSVAQSLAIERVFPPIFAASIERLLSQPEVQDVLESAGEITLRFTPPSQGSEWLVEARGGEGLLAFAPGQEFEDGNYGASGTSLSVARDRRLRPGRTLRPRPWTPMLPEEAGHRRPAPPRADRTA